MFVFAAICSSFYFFLILARGSGTEESAVVASRMSVNPPPNYTVHIGDVYFVGTTEEVASNCLGQAPANTLHGVQWPGGSLGSFALNGNHEMYSRGFGYFDTWLPKLGCIHTFFARESKYVLCIHLCQACSGMA
jgi:hypothetical protein